MVKQINLLPAELRPQPVIRWKVVLLTAVVLCLLGAGLAYFMVLSTRISVLSNQLAVVEQQINSLKYISVREGELKALREQVNAISTEYQQGRPLESDLLELVEDSLPPTCMLEMVNLSDNTLVIDGQAASLTDVAFLAMKLESWSVFEAVTVGTIVQHDDSRYGFEVNCVLAWNRGADHETK